MTDTPQLPDAAVIAELATAATEPTVLRISDRDVVVGQLPDNWSLQHLDLEPFELVPHRKRGTVKVHTTESLLDYIDLQEEEGDTPLAVIWVQPEAFTAVAVLNGHNSTGPGWGDHRAELKLRPTLEWEAWSKADKNWFRAEELAEFIEEWRHTIAEPPTADLLDMVRNFRATQKVLFRQEIIEKSGDRALEYVTETEATAGPAGRLAIPDEFILVLAPFDGAGLRPIAARFRYRLPSGGGTAHFGVVLDQPAQVARTAFEDEIARIHQHAPFTVLVGTPGPSGWDLRP
jgi:uncharacterized protein YfdQ (DUF2303 family)